MMSSDLVIKWGDTLRFLQLLWKASSDPPPASFSVLKTLNQL